MTTEETGLCWPRVPTCTCEWYFCPDSETVAGLIPKAPTLAVP